MRTKFNIFYALAATGLMAFSSHPDANPEKVVVVIDAGHGGLDFGAQHEQHHEKEIVWAISEKMREKCLGRNIEVHLTREGDDFVALRDRTEKINRVAPDIVLSFHVNASPDEQINGTEFFFASESPYKGESQKIASDLKNVFESKLGRQIRVIREAPFHVLKKSNSPALIIELGYVTNPDDLQFLIDGQSQDQLASALTDFVSAMAPK